MAQISCTDQTPFQTPDPSVIEAPKPLRARLVVAAALGAMLALGGAFWVLNGPRAFGELMLGAFSLCF